MVLPRTLPRLPCLFLGIILIALGARGATGEAPITRLSIVKVLQQEEAAAGVAVRVRGVVIEAEVNTFVIHDGSEGLFILGREGHIPPFGREVIVEGRTSTGDFSPVVRAERIETLDTKEPAPLVIRDFDALASASMDCQWVEVEGLLRSAQPPTPAVPCYSAYAVLSSGTTRLNLSFTDTPFAELQRWVGSRVRLRAACLHYFNPHGQVYGARLIVPNSSAVQVLEPALPRGAVPLSRIDSLLRYTPQEQSQGPVHIRGVVTYRKGTSELYVQQGQRGVYVHHSDQRKLSVGDLVDVVGFIRRGVYSPEIEDAVTELIGRQAEPVPRPVSAADAKVADAELVELQGVLLDHFRGPETTVLTLKAEGAPFTAVLPAGTDPRKLPAAGSRVSLTGVVRILQAPPIGAPFPWTPSSFELRLRSEEDLRVLQRPALNRALWVFVGATVLTSVGLLLAGTLWWQSKAKLREQKRKRIAREAEFAAMIKERMRLSREIHDSLAQGFTAVSIQLEIAKHKLPSEATQASEHIEAARALVRESLAEARHSIQGLRMQTLSSEEFLAALTRAASRILKDTGISFDPVVEGDLSRLGSDAQAELLRIATEAMTNTVKHAQAKAIRLGCRVASGYAELRVSDDGIGLPEGKGSTAGFGLRGMQERAHRLNGHLVISGEPGNGTHVIARIPLEGSSCSAPSNFSS